MALSLQRSWKKKSWKIIKDNDFSLDMKSKKLNPKKEKEFSKKKKKDKKINYLINSLVKYVNWTKPLSDLCDKTNKQIQQQKEDGNEDKMNNGSKNTCYKFTLVVIYSSSNN